VPTIRQLRSEVDELRHVVARMQCVEQHEVFLQAVGPDNKPSGPVRRLKPDGSCEEHTGPLEGAIELVPHGPARTWQEYW
jgi:hypothetical protein